MLLNNPLKENVLYWYNPAIETYLEENPVDRYSDINIFGVYSAYDKDRHGWQEECDLWIYGATLIRSLGRRPRWEGFNVDGEVCSIFTENAERIIILSDKTPTNIERFNHAYTQHNDYDFRNVVNP